MRRLECTVEGVSRLVNTINGNPRYKVKTNRGTFTTKPNSGFVFNINWSTIEGKNVMIIVDNHRKLIDISV